MSAYPNTVHFTRLNRPVSIEWSARNLPVEGQIPAEIDGAFFRAVPDPTHPPLFEDDHALAADGMVSRFLVKNGTVDHAIKYVQTPRYVAEREARESLFGRYRNRFTDKPAVQNVDRAVANTTSVWHAGRLLMTKEDALAYEINPHTLETVGRYDFGGKWKSETMTAHVRVDPATGEMFFFGYEAGGICTNDVAYGIADKDGNLVSEQWFEQPYCSSIHDFVITEKYAIFPLFPTLVDLERLKAGGVHWLHEGDQDSWLGVMPRYGKVSELRWFKGPKGVSAYHMVNAFDEGDKIHVDLCLSATNAFPFMHKPDDPLDPRNLNSSLTRWTVDLSKADAQLESSIVGPPGDLPRLADADQGRPYKNVWMPTYDPRIGPPVVGGPVGACFNAVLHVRVDTGRVDALTFGPGWAFNEPVHVPSKQPGHEGWLLLVADHEIDETRHESELLVVDAGNISAGPVARVKMPVPLRPQVHGWWVTAEQLANSKHKGAAA
ncbi:MAG: carotenoid oxygenase family protein [Steroidobacteraceae bacterium]